jgi:hypothetical protein
MATSKNLMGAIHNLTHTLRKGTRNQHLPKLLELLSQNELHLRTSL